ncbi:hypothetical protein BGZ81_003780 [Podila clonocystis]|nr:hypothetical protein BGZ81_003780 [Podila clonocystis]
MKSILSLTYAALVILSLSSACAAMDAALDKCSRESVEFGEFRTCLDGVRAKEVSAEKEGACLSRCDTIYNCVDNPTPECEDAHNSCERDCVV